MEFDGLRELRTTRGFLDSKITQHEAYARAVLGEIEAVVANNSGQLKYFRLLPSAMAQSIKEDTMDDHTDKGSTAFARTNMGVFREPLRQAVVVERGMVGRQVDREGEVVGYCFTHCALRDAFGKQSS